MVATNTCNSTIFLCSPSFRSQHDCFLRGHTPTQKAIRLESAYGISFPSSAKLYCFAGSKPLVAVIQ